MKHLLETMYILTPESYLFHRNDNICVAVGGEEKISVPIRQIESIVIFGNNTCSTSLLGFCASNGVSVVFLNAYGRFLARVCGPVSGNVLLRKKQYETLDNPVFSCQLVRHILYGKILNSKNVLMRHARSCEDEEIEASLRHTAENLAGMAQKLEACQDIDSMRGIEGAAATAYFSQFDHML